MRWDFWNNPIVVSAFRVKYRRGGLFHVTTLYLILLVAGGTVMGVDTFTPLDWARSELGPGVAVQGNLEPILLSAPREVLAKRVDDVLRRAGGAPGHVFNLGHGLLPQTPTDSVSAVVDEVRTYSSRQRTTTNRAPP